MNLPLAVNMTLMGILTACVLWPAAIRAYNIMDRYGKNQLIQKQNYHNSRAWFDDVNLMSSRASPYGVITGGGGGDGGGDGDDVGGGDFMMENYERRLGDDDEGMMADDDGVVAINKQNNNNNNNMLLPSNDYYYDDTEEVSPYGSLRRWDYAMVKYPSYGYYPGADDLRIAGYKAGASEGKLFQYGNGQTFGNRNPVASPAAAVSSALSSYYKPPVQTSAVINGYVQPSSPIKLNRGFETSRYPMDNLHRFRKVFFSNSLSPSISFKSPEERQMNDSWESLINENLMGNVRQTTNVNRIVTADQPVQMTDLDRLPMQQSPLFQHLPFSQRVQKQQQKFQKHNKQYQQQHHHHHHHHHRQQHVPSQQQQAQKLVQYQYPIGERKSSPLMQPRTLHNKGNLFNEWVSGMPLMKRTPLAGGNDGYGVALPPQTASADNDDVRQLEQLKTGKVAAVEADPIILSTTVASTADTGTSTGAPTPMADGGQREYVLPRPAGEKSGLESLFEVIAEGGLRGNYDRNATANSTHSKLREEVRVNKKRSFVSDETSLAAQLGALRKN